MLANIYLYVVQVYVTMYLNDCQRTAFYEGIGLNTKEFDMHVIIEVSLSRIGSCYFDCEQYAQMLLISL